MSKEKEYFENNSSGTFMYATNYMQEVYDTIINDGLETYNAYSILMSTNIKLLKERLGRQDFCTSDSSGRRLYVWRRQLSSGSYWIITGGNGRGTSYEIDESVDVNEVMYDIIDVYELKHILPIIEPFNLKRY